jgi:FMN-dependent NADH-azoreductase
MRFFIESSNRRVDASNTQPGDPTMNTLLQIDTASIPAKALPAVSPSQFVAAWSKVHPDTAVIHRDLARDPCRTSAAERFAAFLAKPEARTARAAGDRRANPTR